MIFVFAGLLLAVLLMHYQERGRLTDALRAERESFMHRLSEERVAADIHLKAQTAGLLGLVSDLCQRIQAPEQAVVEHTARTLPLDTPEAVNPESDESYWTARGLTTEQLAELAYAEELAG